MIKRLRRKLVFVVMGIVTLILLAIFITMLTTMQRNNERTSLWTLRMALSTGFAPRGNTPRADAHPSQEFRSSTPGAAVSGMRLPVLVVYTDEDGAVSSFDNQLYFIETEDIWPIAALVLANTGETGILRSYELRYLREATEAGTRIALADISMEREILSTQIKNSLLIGSAAIVAFFFLSVFLARWMVRPVEAAWERQRQFIANASHELKTPLTVILSNADMLGTDGFVEDEKNVRRAEHIQVEAMRMKKLVEDMLTLAKSDSAETAGVHCLVDFSYIVKSAVLVYEPIVFDGGRLLSYEIADGFFVMGDSQSLQQAIHALLDNALKYSCAGGLISVGLCRPDHETLRLTVENEGPPIPAHELESIFLRFYRRNESRSDHGSFGLGLSIAQSIVSEHDGKIWAESDGVSKNRFYVSLTLASGS